MYAIFLNSKTFFCFKIIKQKLNQHRFFILKIYLILPQNSFFFGLKHPFNDLQKKRIKIFFIYFRQVKKANQFQVID